MVFTVLGYQPENMGKHADGSTVMQKRLWIPHASISQEDPTAIKW